MPVCFDDFAQLNRAAIFHRLPDGVGGFVEKDFVGHGGRANMNGELDSPGGAAGLAGRRKPPESLGSQSTIEAPEGRHRTATATNDVAPSGLCD